MIGPRLEKSLSKVICLCRMVTKSLEGRIGTPICCMEYFFNQNILHGSCRAPLIERALNTAVSVPGSPLAIWLGVVRFLVYTVWCKTGRAVNGFLGPSLYATV